jgi:hypothetical protein
MNISRNSSSEKDMNDFLMPLIPCLCNLLYPRGSHPDTQSMVENVSLIILRICESVFRILSPHNQLERLSRQLEIIGSTGIVDAIIQSLQEYVSHE